MRHEARGRVREFGTRRHFSGFLHVPINVDIATADLTNPSYGPQMSLIEVDVLVIGAGPTGLGAATRLNMHKKESWVSRTFSRRLASHSHTARSCSLTHQRSPGAARALI